MEIIAGVYEALISRAIEKKLAVYSQEDYFIRKEKIDDADSHIRLADYLASVVANILKEDFRDKDAKSTISKQVEVVNRILEFIGREWETEKIKTEQDQLSEESKYQFLRGIYSKIGYTNAQIEAKARNHPISGYRVSSLFTGGNDISMDEEIRRDIQTADEIDLVVSFIKFEGLRLLFTELKNFVQRADSKLRVITTTYMGATDPKAIRNLHKLSELGNVQIRASFNTQQERLHAKAYIFNRRNGYDTAYIGSSNLSRSALTKGLEWNMRVTSIENPHIINKTKATFENYWNSDEFEPIDSEESLQRFEDAIMKERHVKKDTLGQIEYIVRFERKSHQIRVLEKLQYEREIEHSYRNLIVAATGTGKTAISAFDFKDFDKKMVSEQGRHARLLFVVHREKILKQARFTFRSVMVDANFGEIWTGNIVPNQNGNLDHLFTTIQTLNNHWDDILSMGADYYDYVVIDNRKWITTNLQLWTMNSRQWHFPDHPEFGFYYMTNTFAEIDALLPSGWRRPNYADCQSLISQGYAAIQGTGWTQWSSATNSSGFNAMPCGRWREPDITPDFTVAFLWGPEESGVGWHNIWIRPTQLTYGGWTYADAANLKIALRVCADA